jgi:tripartite-type tricarboxylate transporter receptor subunit TctC
MKGYPILRLAAAALCAAATSAVAQAQSASEFPRQPIRIIVPYSAGGSADTMARDIAAGLGQIYRQPVVVDNRPGGGGHIGAEQVVNAPPDGHTLMLGTISHHGAYRMYRKLRYDPPKDLRTVVLVAESFNVLMVRETLPVKTAQELLAMAKAEPGKLTYASAGSGSATHMAAELYKHMAKVDLLGVPFKGGAPAQVALLGGHVDVNFETAITARAAIQSGKVRPLAVTSRQRSPSYPDLPTIAESGVPDYAAEPWYTIATGSAVPDDVVAKLNADINRVLKSPELASRWSQQGLMPLGGTPQDAQARNRAETRRWEAVIDAAGIQVE